MKRWLVIPLLVLAGSVGAQELPDWSRYEGSQTSVLRERVVGVITGENLIVALGGASVRGTPQVTFSASDATGYLTADARLPQGDVWGWVDSVTALLVSPVARSQGEIISRLLAGPVVDFGTDVGFGIVQTINGDGGEKYKLIAMRDRVVLVEGYLSREQFMLFLSTIARATDIADSITATNREIPYTPAVSFLDRVSPSLRHLRPQPN